MDQIYVETSQDHKDMIEETRVHEVWPADGMSLKDVKGSEPIKNETSSCKDKMELEILENQDYESRNYFDHVEDYEEEKREGDGINFVPPIPQRHQRELSLNERNNLESNQSSRDPEYKKESPNTLEMITGKLKYSKKIFFPSSPNIFNISSPEIKASTNMKIETQEDIETPEEQGYLSGRGEKKVKIGTKVDDVGTYQAVSPSIFETPMNNELEIEQEKNLIHHFEVMRINSQSTVRWLVKILKRRITNGIFSVEFSCVEPNSKDNNSNFAIINSSQTSAFDISLGKRYYFINPTPFIEQKVQGKRVYRVDRIEEAELAM